MLSGGGVSAGGSSEQPEQYAFNENLDINPTHYLDINHADILRVSI